MALACRRPDPCNGVDCAGTFDNSECANIDSLGKCLCSSNYEIWQETGGSILSGWEEYTSQIYFEVTDTGFQCNPSLPCLSDPCSAAANSVCTVEAVSGLPTAHCTCDTGYEDVSDADNKVEAGGTLTCTNIDECTDEIHLCAETEVRIMTIFSLLKSDL